jgi:hypothetical protein
MISREKKGYQDAKKHAKVLNIASAEVKAQVASASEKKTKKKAKSKDDKRYSLYPLSQ